MSESTLTHKDLASLLGVSETTVKSYRRKFPGCIPVASKGKPIRFTPEAAAVAVRIRDLFETGMSVDEVRTRLAAEFSWIAPEAPAPAKGTGKEAPQAAQAGAELSHGVSNMAKSLVAMTQQQKAILARIQGLENLLEDLGVGERSGALTEAAGQRAEAARMREAQLAERLSTLDRLDDTVATLSASMRELSSRLDSLLARRAKAAEEWRQSGQETMNAAARLAEEAQRPTEQRQTPPPHPEQAPQPEQARIIPLRPNGKQGATPAPTTPRPAPEQAREPERRFFSLPLVARTEQGRFISAGGKTRGPFSLNDLKAMLIYGFTPPDHFSLHFEAHGQGWWLTLEQETSGRRIRLLLMELPTQRGGSVAEILQIENAGDSVHPAEICGIIDSFTV